MTLSCQKVHVFEVVLKLVVDVWLSFHDVKQLQNYLLKFELQSDYWIYCGFG